MYYELRKYLIFVMLLAVRCGLWASNIGLRRTYKIRTYDKECCTYVYLSVYPKSCIYVLQSTYLFYTFLTTNSFWRKSKLILVFLCNRCSSFLRHWYKPIIMNPVSYYADKHPEEISRLSDDVLRKLSFQERKLDDVQENLLDTAPTSTEIFAAEKYTLQLLPSLFHATSFSYF